MTEFVIVDPYACSVQRYVFPDIANAKKVACLDGEGVDTAHLWGPFGDQPGCGVMVYQFGLIEPPGHHKFFAIGGQLFAGRAILWGFDRRGETVDVPANCNYRDLNPIWLGDEREVERAISSKLVNRPRTVVNGKIIWEWPSK